MERHGQVNQKSTLAESHDLRDQADGGYGDPTRRVRKAQGVSQDRERLYSGVVVMEWFPHPHQHQIADSFSWQKIPLERERLIDDLSRLQVPDEPHCSSQAKGAGQSTTYLGGKTSGQPPLIGDQHRLNRSPIRAAKQVFPRAVLGDLSAERSEGANTRPLGQPLA